ncbi:hypothetical protein K7G98_02695 [Saccharothrix sp. MB29]|nr:hypothetical protein [Saccharothrix sp. MB29]
MGSSLHGPPAAAGGRPALRRLRELALVANRRAVLRPLEITDLHHEVAVHPRSSRPWRPSDRLDRTAAKPPRRRRRSW